MKGRQHPVKIYHSATDQMDYLDAALRTFFQIHMDQPPGDVLVFLPGTYHSVFGLVYIYTNLSPQDRKILKVSKNQYNP